MRERERSEGARPTRAVSVGETELNRAPAPAPRLYSDCCGKLALATELTMDNDGWLVCAECLAEDRAERMQGHDATMCNHPRCRLPF